jgi:hypothetical protein
MIRYSHNDQLRRHTKPPAYGNEANLGSSDVTLDENVEKLIEYMGAVQTAPKPGQEVEATRPSNGAE